MPKLPAMTPKAIIKFLEKQRFVTDHVTGSHYIMYRESDKRMVTVPCHNRDIPKGTLLSILDMAGIDRKSFRK